MTTSAPNLPKELSFDSDMGDVLSRTTKIGYIRFEELGQAIVERYNAHEALAAERDALKAALTTARVWMRAINALAGSPESESEPLAVIAAALALSQPKP